MNDWCTSEDAKKFEKRAACVDAQYGDYVAVGDLKLNGKLTLGVWCSNLTDEAARLRALTDPHSPGKYRTNGAVSNMPEFWQAFACKPGQPMVRGENDCRVW